jgi:hypothetical protein
LGQNDRVRRSVAGLLFGIAFALACIAVSGFLLLRTAFSPQNTFDSADVVLDDSAVRDELVRVVSEATVAQLSGGDPAQAATIEDNIALVADTEPGAAILAEVLRDAHAHLIGQDDSPVQITPQQLVQVVRDERAAALPPITLDVPRVGVLATMDDVLRWLVPVSAIAAIVIFVLCLLAHPEKSALLRTLGFGLVVLAALTIIFGWVVPTAVPPLLDDSPWTHIPPSLATASVGLTLGAALLLAGGGLALLAAAGRMGRSRRWSTPVNTYRYRDERRWS